MNVDHQMLDAFLCEANCKDSVCQNGQYTCLPNAISVCSGELVAVAEASSEASKSNLRKFCSVPNSVVLKLVVAHDATKVFDG